MRYRIGGGDWFSGEDIRWIGREEGWWNAYELQIAFPFAHDPCPVPPSHAVLSPLFFSRTRGRVPPFPRSNPHFSDCRRAERREKKTQHFSANCTRRRRYYPPNMKPSNGRPKTLKFQFTIVDVSAQKNLRGCVTTGKKEVRWVGGLMGGGWVGGMESNLFARCKSDTNTVRRNEMMARAHTRVPSL